MDINCEDPISETRMWGLFMEKAVFCLSSKVECYPVNHLRHSRRLEICEPLKAVENHEPPQRWREFT